MTDCAMYNITVQGYHPSTICVVIDSLPASLEYFKDVINSPLIQDSMNEFIEEFARTDEIMPSDRTLGFVIINSSKKVRDAGISFHNFTTGFGGKGETYSTREKGAYQYTVKVMQNYNRIAKKVKEFTIENLDFREIIAKYDDSDSFFYIDPSYH